MAGVAIGEQRAAAAPRKAATFGKAPKFLLHPLVWVSLISMHWTEVRGAEVIGRRAKAFSLNG